MAFGQMTFSQTTFGQTAGHRLSMLVRPKTTLERKISTSTNSRGSVLEPGVNIHTTSVFTKSRPMRKVNSLLKYPLLNADVFKTSNTTMRWWNFEEIGEYNQTTQNPTDQLRIRGQQETSCWHMLLTGSTKAPWRFRKWPKWSMTLFMVEHRNLIHVKSWRKLSHGMLWCKYANVPYYGLFHGTPEVPDRAKTANDPFHGYRNPIQVKSWRKTYRTVCSGVNMQMSPTTGSTRAPRRFRCDQTANDLFHGYGIRFTLNHKERAATRYVL